MSAIGRLACEAACNPSNVNTYGWGILVGTAISTLNESDPPDEKRKGLKAVIELLT